MELQDRSRSPSRRTSRVEQVVGRWLRRSRDLGSRSHSLNRDRVAADGKPAESSCSDQRNYPFRFNVQIQRDPNFTSHGLTLSSQIPILVQEVSSGGPADGRLVPGDQLVKINNVSVDDLTPEQAVEIIRECHDTLTMTVIRIMQGPKSSFITPEKRAKLRSNPVKVHFAEEVEVNGHSQGNSLLFLPNVLKVYLENGQTKAFKFEPGTTVKDIVMTLKEKLSLSRIEHFSLVLEQQHSSTKLLLLHDEERIQQVVQKKEAPNYRCLFRVCFMPKDFHTLLQDDPIAFEYLYLQGVNDVLQERYAVEMRCNTALRLAALHIQERLLSCGLSPKANLKTITKTWGIENFVSSTLLRNMRDKDLKKAISYHMKKSQSQLDPKQKTLSVHRTRITYLEELSDLKCFGGKSFSATMMLQDRESTVTLLVGARYGVSQVVNNKLSILTNLTEFSNITRVELLPESDKVSLVKIYLQDIKPITLLLEAAAAKDMSCLIAGYCRVFVDPSLNIFTWMDDKKHRVSAEEGYVSRRASDSDDSSDLDMEPLFNPTSHSNRLRVRSSSDSDGRKRRERVRPRGSKEKVGVLLEVKKTKQKDAEMERKNREGWDEDAEETERDVAQIQIQMMNDESRGQDGQELRAGGGGEMRAADEQPSEASDSCQTDSRILTSPSSDSLDALEEDDLISCSSSCIHPNSQTHLCIRSPFQRSHALPHLHTPPPAHSHPLHRLTAVNSEGDGGQVGSRKSGDGDDPFISTSSQSPNVQTGSGDLCSVDTSLCFAELSRLADLLPSPPEASEEDEDEELRRKVQKELGVMLREAGEVGSQSQEGGVTDHPVTPSPSSPLSSQKEFVFNFDQSDARCYYNLCSNITPDSARSPARSQGLGVREAWEEEEQEEILGDERGDLEPVPILQPPPGFGDSSSDEEFYDARDRFTSPEDLTSVSVQRDCTETKQNCVSLSDIRVTVMDSGKGEEAEVDKQQDDKGKEGGETLFHFRKRSRKRRSFMETDYTSRVTNPEPDPESKHQLASGRILKNILAESSNGHVLSLDPEPSGQTQIPSPTVSSLTHAEGEPAQLESKPILSKVRSHEPRSLSASDQRENTQSSSRARTQEMEMEPDAMESKPVTDLMKVVSSNITVVRCRVDPDGKESADRRGDGKEEPTGVFSSHMFLPDIQKKEDQEEEERKVDRFSPRPPVGAERSQEDTIPPEGFTEEFVDKCFPLLCSPPPPPPSPLLPQKHKSESDCLMKKEEIRDMETSKKPKILGREQSPDLGLHHDNHITDANVFTSINDEEAISVLKFNVTANDEITESSNSDNVFDDDDVDVSNSLNYASDDEKAQCHSTEVDEDDSNISRSVEADYAFAINSITAKLGAATSVLSPTFSSGPRLKSELQETSNEKAEKPKSNSTLLSAEAKKKLASLMMAKPNSLSKELLPPTHFLFQSCSPSIMGRLSASTLRGKIQSLPLYLSRSHESLNRAEVGSPAEDADRDDADRKMSDVHSADPTLDLEMDTEADLVESDDSDATVTGSEVDRESGFEIMPEKSSPFGSEIKEESFEQPVQTEPKSQQQSSFSSYNKNTPGPVTEPPTSTASLLQKDAIGLKEDTPGPIKSSPELNTKVNSLQKDNPGFHFSSQSSSAPSQIVVTTQNLNGPGLSFHGQSQIVKSASSDRPLLGFCRPSDTNSDSPKTSSGGCKVFTICEDLTQSKTAVDLGSPPLLKSEIGCGSVLASGCETFTDGVQVPLDACGCPTVYSNCFGGENSFDEELTVYEFSRRSQNSGTRQTPEPGLHLITSPPVPSFIPTSSTHSPSFPHPILFSCTSELSPLLSPQSDNLNSYMSQKHKDTISHLGQQRYPKPPAGFQVLRRDVDTLLSILEGSGADRSVTGHGGRHPRDTCPAHFTENKRLLQLEARRLMSGCQEVAGTGQGPEEMLHSLADSFRTLVELAGICLWFSGCDRCDRRNTEAVAGLVDVARSFRDFCLAAERVSGNRSCQDLSTKLLAKQCTALTASVFCLTQLFRTLTSL
ncbi:FERM and PDZ domain-containing protein 1 [Nothobranchius furzeri]|uniref:FERM and PDZ domain containing 1 n=3 Tax=Nothobranchius TaxID=28779 RepID=A0A1A7ZSP0_NOTFU|nr:FERM and PDZ domain-containing protein 1 [Nothobranchius furzeri]KAF7223697.1 FERM and PDZ domain-containing protein 1-like [Nothobranchius furzeri]